LILYIYSPCVAGKSYIKWGLNMLSSNITQLEKVHLATATGLVWNYYSRLVLTGISKVLTLGYLHFYLSNFFFVLKGILKVDCTMFDSYCS
jgi:hypothetical protein